MPTVTIKKDMHKTLTIDASDTKYVLNKGISIEGDFRGIDEDAMFTGNHYILNGKVTTSAVNGTALFSYGADAEFSIGKAGLVKSDYGIYTQGAGAEVTNNGRVDAKEVAIEMEGDSAVLTNNGRVVSHDNYAFLNVSSTSFHADQQWRNDLQAGDRR